MFNLSNYLDKFKNIKDPKEDKSVIASIILESANVTISEPDISLEKNVIHIRGNSVSKSRIYMKKEEILAKIGELLPDLKITDIN